MAVDKVSFAGFNNGDFAVKYVLAEIPGVNLHEEKTVEIDSGKRVLLTYKGEKSFTLVQEKSEEGIA